MSRTLSSREVVTILLREGFVFISQRGSHAKYRKMVGGKTVTVIILAGKHEIPTGTLRSIIRQSQLEKDYFFKED